MERQGTGTSGNEKLWEREHQGTTGNESIPHRKNTHRLLFESLYTPSRTPYTLSKIILCFLLDPQIF